MKAVEVTFSTVPGELLVQSLTVIVSKITLALLLSNNIIFHFVHLKNARPKLEALKKVIERDKIKLVVGMTFPLNQVAQAEQKLEEGGVGVHGKIVV